MAWRHSGYRRQRPAAAAGGGATAPMAEINVTPLVDVMLVLLIIFMVTAPLLTVGVPVDLPKTQAPPINEPKEPLVITVNAEGAIFLQETERRRSTTLVAAAARRSPAAIPTRVLYVRGDKDDRLRPGDGGDGPRQRRRLPQGGAGRRGAEGQPARLPAAGGRRPSAEPAGRDCPR